MSSSANPKIVKGAVQAGSASSKLIECIAPVISEGLVQSMELEQRERNETKKAKKGEKIGSFDELAGKKSTNIDGELDASTIPIFSAIP